MTWGKRRRPFDSPNDKIRRKAENPYWGLKRLYKVYQRNAETRGRTFFLSIEDFERLTKMNCAYCDRPPAQKSGAYLYNGLDRVNTHAGYSLENCKACCWECNRMKGSQLSEGEMRAVGQALKDFRNKNGK